MMNLIVAALAATAAPTAAQPAGAHAQHQQMGHEQGSTEPAKKDCCCKDKMAKMDGEHADQHENHKQ